jgi:uncharacterized protein (DUF427 family)
MEPREAVALLFSSQELAMSETTMVHRIEIVPNSHRVRVIHQGVTYADSQRTFTLREAALPDVMYFPRADVNMARLERSMHSTHCPFKGQASYFHLKTEDDMIENAVWSYETPIAPATPIAGYLAFYASLVDLIEQTS